MPAILYHNRSTGADAIHELMWIGSADPAATPANDVQPHQFWLDTTNGATLETGAVLKERNAGNTAWTTRAALGTAAALASDTDGTLAANSDTKVATQKATRTAINTALAGLSWKQAVRAATTAAGTLASSFENGDTVDGVALVTGDRILIKNQATASENGIYIVAASGAPARSTDADSGAELVNASMYVSEGTVNADTQWVCTTNAPITPGATSLAFAQLTSGTGTTLDGLSDVVITSAANGDVLVFDSGSGHWVNQTPAASTIDNLSDVDATSPSDGDVLVFDSGSGHWVAQADPGGGGPAVTGSFDMYDPDKPEGSPSSLDDDFDSSTIDPKYALVNMASGVTYDVDTTKPSAIFMSSTSADQVLHTALDTIPAGDFVYQTRFSVRFDAGGNQFFGLCLADGATAGSGNQRVMGYACDGAAQTMTRKSFSWTGFNAAGGSSATSNIEYSHQGFIRVRRVGTTIHLDYSADGRLWENWAGADITEATLGFTVSRCGVYMRNGSGGNFVTAYDHVRYSATSTHLFGGKRTIATV